MLVDAVHLNPQFVHSQSIRNRSAKQVVRARAQLAIVEGAEDVPRAPVGDHNTLRKQRDIRAGGHRRVALHQGTSEGRRYIAGEDRGLQSR